MKTKGKMKQIDRLREKFIDTLTKDGFPVSFKKNVAQLTFREETIDKLISLVLDEAIKALPRKYDEIEDWNACLEQSKKNIEELK